jgi:thioredoxin-related protein
MKYFVLMLLTTLVGCTPSPKGPEVQLPWQTDLPKAQTQARAENKAVLINFTGSDWCPWCVKLSKEIFNTPEFAAFAETNLALVEADFPRRKPISDELKKANEALAKQYNIEFFPTLVLLDAEGRDLGRLGYALGGPKPFIAELEKLRTPGR